MPITVNKSLFPISEVFYIMNVGPLPGRKHILWAAGGVYLEREGGQHWREGPVSKQVALGNIYIEGEYIHKVNHELPSAVL